MLFAAANCIDAQKRMAMISSSRIVQIVAAGLGIALLWSYWPVLAGEVDRWTTDPKYSHGYIVPLFSLWLLWSRFQRTADGAAARIWVSSWLGLPVLAASVAMHMVGEFFYVDWLSEVSFLPALAGLCLCIGGWPLLRLAGPSIGYLAFMLPLPFFVEVALANPLQRLATVVCTYLLQTLGFAASAEGNTIVLNQPPPLEVAEACSGLGMLVTFFALCAAVAIVMKRPLLDKMVVVLSAIPVAVLANIIRITITGILYETVGAYVGEFIYHGLTGLVVMMPIALLLIWLELKVLSHLLVELPPPAPTEIGLNLGPSPPPAPTGRKKNSHAIV